MLSFFNLLFVWSFISTSQTTGRADLLLCGVLYLFIQGVSVMKLHHNSFCPPFDPKGEPECLLTWCSFIWDKLSCVLSSLFRPLTLTESEHVSAVASLELVSFFLTSGTFQRQHISLSEVFYTCLSSVSLCNCCCCVWCMRCYRMCLQHRLRPDSLFSSPGPTQQESSCFCCHRSTRNPWICNYPVICVCLAAFLLFLNLFLLSSYVFRLSVSLLTVSFTQPVDLSPFSLSSNVSS